MTDSTALPTPCATRTSSSRERLVPFPVSRTTCPSPSAADLRAGLLAPRPSTVPTDRANRQYVLHGIRATPRLGSGAALRGRPPCPARDFPAPRRLTAPALCRRPCPPFASWPGPAWRRLGGPRRGRPARPVARRAWPTGERVGR